MEELHNMDIVTQRPEYIGPTWLKHTTGFAFASPPPEELASDRYLLSPNLWERAVCITLQAQRGDFRNVGALVDTVNLTTDPYLGVAAVKVFAHAAPSSILPRLTAVFDHRDYDIRIESYTAPGLACHLSLVEPLLQILPTRRGDERGYIADTLWELLEADQGEGAQLMGLDEDDALIPVARRLAREIQDRYGAQTAIRYGAPLDLSRLIDMIRELCDREDYKDMSGDIDDLMSIFEAMTGVSRAGCSTNDCTAVLPEIAAVLDTFVQSGRIEHFEPGYRYFFAHLIPDRA
jgi:hypothetical protein